MWAHNNSIILKYVLIFSYHSKNSYIHVNIYFYKEIKYYFHNNTSLCIPTNASQQLFVKGRVHNNRTLNWHFSYVQIVVRAFVPLKKLVYKIYRQYDTTDGLRAIKSFATNSRNGEMWIYDKTLCYLCMYIFYYVVVATDINHNLMTINRGRQTSAIVNVAAVLEQIVLIRITLCTSTRSLIVKIWTSNT